MSLKYGKQLYTLGFITSCHENYFVFHWKQINLEFMHVYTILWLWQLIILSHLLSNAVSQHLSPKM